MRKFLLLLCFLALGNISYVNASHLMGGEITWQCFKSGPNIGKFKFRVKLYRDCNGIPADLNITLQSNAPGLAGGLNCNRISDADISPIGPGCPTCANPMGFLNAVQEVIYESNFINITGVPPATGWNFYYTSCCRNTGITNLAAAPGDFCLRAIMFPYNGTNTNPCYDSSPQFAERPQLATCTRNLTRYNHNAIDQEQDSLVYEWGRPLTTSPTGPNYNFAPGYSFTSPLPSPAQNPLNVAAVLNPTNGEVSFTSYTPGAFVTVNKVTAYRCGIKVAEIYREIQIALFANCIISGTGPNTVYNTPPDVNPPFPANPNPYLDTVNVGDTVNFTIIATDFEALANGNVQSLTFTATGVQFASDFTTETACDYPPCATVTPVTPVTTPLQGQVTFRWRTDCVHLGGSNGTCSRLSSTYNFVLKCTDNFCPSPSVNFTTITIVVLAPPVVPAPLLKCADVLPNGNVKLGWIPPPDVGAIDTLKYFKAYYIYRASAAAGPYTLIDSVLNVNTFNYTDLTANANLAPLYYYVNIPSGCDTVSPNSDTLATMFLQVNQVGANAQLTWNPLLTPLLASSTRRYDIYKEQLPAGSGIWNLIGNTTNLIFNDPVSVCSDSINYRVQVTDTSAVGGGCISRSTIDGAQLAIALPNITSPSLRCVSVLTNGDIQLNWVGSLDTAGYFASYEVYQATALAGPYTKIGSVANYALNTFTHVGANGNNVINYYYLKTKAGCDAATAFECLVAGDTLASIKLNSAAALGFANLSWNAQRVPLLPSSSGQYSIYKRVPPTLAWTFVGNSATTSYQDVVILCNSPIEYKVEITDGSGCISVSSINLNTYTSLGNVIAAPLLKCVSVQANGQIALTWQNPTPGTFADFNEYEIWRNSGTGFVRYDSVGTSGTTTYTDIAANGSLQSYSYYLITQAGCTGQVNSLAPSDTLRSMLLTVSNATLGFATLNWTTMRTPALTTAPGPYRVMRRTTGVGPYVQIGTTALTTYQDPITTCNVPYEYRIELDNTIPACTSTSNAANGVFTYIGNIIASPILTCLSVQVNGQIALTWQNPTPTTFADFNEYEIYRNSGAGFVLYDSVGTSGSTSYTDLTANGNTQSYSYYLLTQSGCTGQVNAPAPSDTLRSIYLTVSNATLGFATLNWNVMRTPALTTAPGPYRVMRRTTGVGAYVQVGTTALTTYQDPITSCNVPYEYRIELDNTVPACVSTSNAANGVFTYLGNIIASPTLACVSVGVIGNITLTWQPPTPTSFADFNEYEIWRNSGAGFVRYDSVGTSGTTSYTDVLALGNIQSYSYYIVTQSGCTGQVNAPANSDTLRSMYLTVSNATLGFASLSWNAMRTPPLSTAPGPYKIMRRTTGVGAFVQVGTSATTTYQDPITSCNVPYEYRIDLDNSVPSCTSVSNTASGIFTYLGNVIASPILTCLSVQANGQIALTWQNPTPTTFADFNEYEIWRNSGAGFVKYDSVGTSGTTTYTDITANGNTQSYSYYLITQSGCTGQVDAPAPSDTLRSIYLTVSNATLGFATLNWNVMRTPALATAPGPYRVMRRSTGVGAYVQIGTTALTTYQDPITTCNVPYEYRIELDNSIPACTSTSNAANGVFTYVGNVIASPLLTCLSVQANGQIALTWQNPTPTTFTDFNEYEIWRNSGAGFVLYDSVGTSGTTTYTDVTANGNSQSYSYYLITQSGCTGQVNAAAPSDTLRSIYLTVSNATLGFANLSWNAMRTPSLPTAPGPYKVFRRTTGVGGYVQIGTSATTTYQDPITTCNVPYEYRIELDNSIPACTSTSNAANNVFTYIGNVIASPTLTCLSVQTSGVINLTWQNPTPTSFADFNEYEIWRNAGAGFVLIDSVGASGTSTFTDISANGNSQSYSYYLITQSGCTGQVNAPAPSDTLRSIYLTVSNATLGFANLSWNAMRTPSLPTAPGPYKVFRRTTGVGGYVQIGTSATTTYQDPITTCNVPFEYRIELDNSIPACTSTSNAANNVFTYLGNVIQNPTLRCVSVLPNGNISLSWELPTGTADFNEYEIWRNAGGGFTAIDSISNNTTFSYTDLTANGNTQSYSYYLVTQSGCTGQVTDLTTVDTLSSIYLTTAATLGNANLNWTALASPLPATSAGGVYNVFSNYNSLSTLAVIGGTSNLVFNEVISDCDTLINHVITVDDSYGCTSRSNVSSRVYTYLGNVVDNPDLRCLNVLPNGQIELTWVVPATSNEDFNEYEIWRNSGGGWNLIDSVGNFNQPIFTDINANGNTQSTSYYVRTQSGCTSQVDNGSTSDSLNSIYLTTTPTLGLATLNWNTLTNSIPSGGSMQYNVFSSYNPANTLQQIGNTNFITYPENILNCDTNLSHQITVNDASGCVSRSNIPSKLFTYIGNVISNPEMRCASVLPNGQVTLTWSNPTPTVWDNFNQYNVYRNTGAGAQLIDSVQAFNLNTYTDLTANANLAAIEYYLVTKSGCTGQTDNGTIGNKFSTIYNKVTGGGNNIATLNWNAPSTPTLPTGSGVYEIQREFPGGSGSWTTVATNVNALTYTEPLLVCIDSVNYRVVTNDAIGCSSVSNVDGEIFIDNSIPDAPELQCISVLPNGNVLLNWAVPVDTARQFNSYQIYASSSPTGPFTVVDSIFTYGTTSATITNFNAQNASVYFYIKTRSGCGVQYSAPSDTLRSIKLEVYNNAGVAMISWTPYTTSGASVNYELYKEYPVGTWSLLTTIPSPTVTHTDTINVCFSPINYRIELVSPAGCKVISSVDGDIFRDITKPVLNLLDSVSLDPNNGTDVSFSWLANNSGDVSGYIVYLFNGASWDSIGATIGRNNLFFQHVNPAAATGPQLYSVSAYDSCGNVSSISSGHNTLFLTAKLDVCRAAIDLRWNPYINMVNGVGNYNVFVSDNGGPFTFLASVPSSNISYSHTTLIRDHTYCYYIQAQGTVTSRTSSSTQACEIANLLTVPTFSYLKYATVTDVRKVVVECLVDTVDNPDVSRYKLQRSLERGGPYTTVAIESYTGAPLIKFTDFSARTEELSYFYRMVTVDSCGNEVLVSNIGRTIFLAGKGEYNLTNKLRWNDYENWLGAVKNYAIFREVDGVWEPAAVNNTIPFGSPEFLDDVAGLYQTQGRFCYRVEAYEGAGNPYGYTDTSRSNEFCLIQEPHLFVPNAFTPEGKNPVLKPQHIFIDFDSYFFAVYNRWGQKVFETKDPNEGWDGTYNGSTAPEGNYVYLVRIYGINGQEIEKNGSVTLLR